MNRITPEQAAKYLGQWKMVRDAEVDELRFDSMDTKLHQLSVLVSSRHLFGTDRDRQRGVEMVRERWAKIREVLGA